MIVITAATPWEARPLAKDLRLTFAGGQPRVYRGRCRGGGRDIALVETGVGPENTVAALSGLGGPVETVISSGLAGALQPGILSGDIVVDPHGAPLRYVQDARRVAADAGLTLHLGVLVSADRVIGSPAAKRTLGAEKRAVAVDMESSCSRAWAEDVGAEFIVVRGVLDALGQRLPEGVPESDSTADLARYALARWRDLPLLLRLAWLKRRSMGRLGRFLTRFLEAA
ncbi:MAG: hypothetical protein ABII00_07545 [Elusimicrobiota bacterium]